MEEKLFILFRSTSPSTVEFCLFHTFTPSITIAKSYDSIGMIVIGYHAIPRISVGTSSCSSVAGRLNLRSQTEDEQELVPTGFDLAHHRRRRQEQRDQSLNQRRMSEDRISESRKRQSADHGYLYRRHDVTDVDAKPCETKDAISINLHQGL